MHKKSITFSWAICDYNTSKVMDFIMSDLFQREQQMLEDFLVYINKTGDAQSKDFAMLETLAGEYGILLEQIKKILKISDKASVGLLNTKRKNEKQIDDLENELMQNQISIMLSQIQPHFLYNSLTAIRELCLIDPEKAYETIDEFSTYLRGNLDSLTIKKPVPFEKELSHVKTYLSLEKKRFGNNLTIIYEINAFYFTIPALTLQPIVENAVRHGVTKREDGGTVTITTEETETEAIITVKDDGIGFDMNNKKDARQRIGIENVRSRLATMCDGSLAITSEPDTGTTVVITIPKGGAGIV